MKATVKKIKVYQTGNVSNYEVYLPAQSSVTGKHIRKRFKRKTDALACADQLNIKAAARNIAPLQNEIHLIAARYQDKLTPAQFEAALEAKLEESKMSNITLKELGEDFISEQESLMELGAVGKLYVKDRTVHSYPADIEENESFQIVSHLGRNRIKTALAWGNFAADTVNSISLSNSDGSRVFEEYARYLKGKGAKLTLKINDYPEDPENMNHEGGQIRGFELQLSSPVIDLSDPNEDQLIDRAFEWSSPLWGMMLSILPTEEMEPEVQELESGLPEGARTRVEVNRYERSRKYRNLCLTVLGASCKVCEFNFGDTFGALGEGYMHVHHLIPVSGMPQDYQFDPLKDLVPVCPNCHSMLHKEDPPLSIEKLKTIMLEEKSDHE